MRIIAGKLKGSILYMPQNKSTRPLKDLARESIFNLLTHSKSILFQFEKSNILDLYAGTGSFGLECLSRQVKRVYFVEKDKDVIEILKKNINKFRLKERTKIFTNDVFDLIEKQNIFGLQFQLIFCDPPFKKINIEKLISLIFNRNLLQKNGIVILHRHKNTKEKFANCFKIIDQRVYGVSKITFGQLFPPLS